MKKYKINVMKWNLEKYNSNPVFYQKFQILLLMENANTHLVSIFKDYLLYDDSTEFFKEFYDKKEIYPRLRTIYDYYESSSYLFPNYTAINEGKYIYRNIIRKQKLIDYLEDLEDKKKEKEEKKNLKNKKKLKNQTQNEQSSSCIEVFDTKIYENIRKETENDSKINELFCVGNKNNNNSNMDCDSFASILKLTEELKEREKDIKDQKELKENDSKKSSSKKETSNNFNINNTSKETNSNGQIKNVTRNINQNKNIISCNIENINLNETEGKIFVSRRVSLNQNNNNQSGNNSQGNQNLKVYNKKTINKGVKNLNINNFINNNNSGLIMKNINLTDRNKNSNKINIDTCKSNDCLNQNNFTSNKNLKDNSNNGTNNNNYKKSNIIINIINSNKNNNYNSTNNYFSNYTNDTNNTNQNNNNENINNNIYFTDLGSIKNNNSNNKNNLITSTNTNEINKNSNTNTNSNPKLNTDNAIKNDKNKNKNKNNVTMGNCLNSKGILGKTSQNISHNKNNNNNTNNSNKKSIQKNKTKQLKSKLLSFRLTDSNFVKNLAERIKNKANSNSYKKGKNKSKTKSIFSPNEKNFINSNNNKNIINNSNSNMKKRTKTEILGNNPNIFIFGQQGENSSYNKSINRQILKNINLTNNSKPHKDISLVNKKIINYRLNNNNINNTHTNAQTHTNYSNNNTNININNNSNSINNCKKCIKHMSTNSQNITDVKSISKIIPFTCREIMKKKGGIGVFSVNKTERTSRNHSKDKINKINNTTVKKNYLESFSPKKTQDLIYNKIHKIQNKKNDSVYTFLKSISSNKKIKNLKVKNNNNYSSINNNNYQGIHSARNNKEIHKRINSGKNN